MDKRARYKKIVEWEGREDITSVIAICVFIWFIYYSGINAIWFYPILSTILIILTYLTSKNLILPKRKVYWVKEDG